MRVGIYVFFKSKGFDLSNAKSYLIISIVVSDGELIAHLDGVPMGVEMSNLMLASGGEK